MTPSPAPSMDSNSGATPKASARAESPAPVEKPAPERAQPPSRLAIATPATSETSPEDGPSPVMTSAAPQVLAASGSLLGGSKARKGLGAKKAVKTGISFEEAERRAREEEERIQAEEERRKKEEEELKRSNPLAYATRGSAGGSSRLNYQESGIVSKPGDEDALDRLGMGLGRLNMGAPAAEKSSKPAPASFGFGFDPTAPPKKGSQQQSFGDVGGFGSTGKYGGGSSKPEEDEDFARKKFSTAKAISSDQYFGRGHWNDDGG